MSELKTRYAAPCARNCDRILIGAILGALACIPGSPSWAQVDSVARPQRLEDVVVAHRASTMLRESVAATTVIDRSTLERLPARTLAEVLGYVPGLTFVARDGSGQLPMAIARGFFGGGETDYVLLTVDGTPVNDLRTGIAEWTQTPLATIERIEVLRGGASTVYGDAALGAVVNVVTRGAGSSPRLASELHLGSLGERAARASIDRPLGSDRLGATATVARVQGFRLHARATNLGFSANYTRRPGQHRTAYASVGVQRLGNQEPGPINAEQIARDPRMNNPLFASDERRRDLIEVGTGLARAPGSGHLIGDIRLRLLDDEQTRTLPFSTDAGDTQFQDARSWDLWARVQYSRPIGRSTIVAGLEGERGRYTVRYTDPVDRALVRSRGNGERNKLGQYTELHQQIGNRLKAVAGARLDFVTVDGAGVAAEPHFLQWSPRVGMNFAYTENPSHPGNVYVAWTRSFKAPTLYQLYDVRLIPTVDPGSGINLSNSALQPQHSSGVEFGVYQRLDLPGEATFAELTLAAYRQEVRDEIDFDLRTFKYGNILQSRHDGIEASLTARLSPVLSLRNAFTLMQVTFRSGENAGKRLKNIPQVVATSSAHLSPGKSIEGTLTHRFVGGLFLDDPNREWLPGSHSFDAMLSWMVGAVRLQLVGVNVGDSHASTGGFLVYDANRGTNVRLLYPSGGRQLRIGATVLR